MGSSTQISREGFSLMNSFFKFYRRWAGSRAGVFCLTSAVLLLAGPVRARAQAAAPEAAPQPAIAASPVLARSQPIAGQITPAETTASAPGTASSAARVQLCAKRAADNANSLRSRFRKHRPRERSRAKHKRRARRRHKDKHWDQARHRRKGRHRLQDRRVSKGRHKAPVRRQGSRRPAGLWTSFQTFAR